MSSQNVFTLINPQNGNLAFKILPFEDNSYFDHLQRNNYYSLIWNTEGSGKVKADFSEYAFEAGSLFAFSPYQPFMFSTISNIKGIAIQFHPDFFCILKHQKEVSCNGVLFNNLFAPPFVEITPEQSTVLESVFKQMQDESSHEELAQNDLLLSYLKIFLI